MTLTIRQYERIVSFEKILMANTIFCPINYYENME
jgi:hypothetical protein